MTHRVFPLLLVSFLALAALGCRSAPLAQDPAVAAGLPPIPREFRSAWVASVANIDWPSAPGLTPAQQRAELVAILDTCAQLNLNAVVLQVRPACDALYDSPFEPWSAYLTAAEGEPPAPGYDPLAFAIEQAHARGIELHAWFNPFRASHATFPGQHAATHISNTHPHLVRQHGKQLWLDPGDPAAREHSLAVIRDVAARYDIDGVHLDDYFYPYPISDDAGKPLPFPDDATYQRYRDDGGKLARDDWRRNNVDTFVEQLYEQVHAIKPHVQVGISPFGIARPGQPAYIKGFDQYAQIYADAERWLAEGWCDYLVPQLYWAIDNPDQSFTGLLRWWLAHNPRDRHVWPGLYTSRTDDGTARAFRDTEVLYQVEWSRILADENSATRGHIHFSMKALMQNRAGLADALGPNHYAQPALTPASPWLAQRRPDAPKPLGYTQQGNRLVVAVDPASVRDGRAWIVQVQRDDIWSYMIAPPSISRTQMTFDRTGNVQRVVVWRTDRTGVGSAIAEVPALLED